MTWGSWGTRVEAGYCARPARSRPGFDQFLGDFRGQAAVDGDRVGAHLTGQARLAQEHGAAHQDADPGIHGRLADRIDRRRQARQVDIARERKAHHVIPVAAHQGLGVQRLGGAAIHVPAGTAEEIAHHHQPEGVLLARAGRQQDAPMGAARGRSGDQAGAEVAHGLLEAADAHGDVGEVAQVLLPQLAEVTGRRSQQVDEQGLDRDTPQAHGLHARHGGAAIRQQHHAHQLPDVRSTDRMTRQDTQVRGLRQVGVCRMCLDQAGNDALGNRGRQQGSVLLGALSERGAAAGGGPGMS